MSASFAGFSDLDVREVVQSLGVDHRITDSLILNGLFQYHDGRDAQPYRADTTGRRLSYLVGATWIF